MTTVETLPLWPVDRTGVEARLRLVPARGGADGPGDPGDPARGPHGRRLGDLSDRSRSGAARGGRPGHPPGHQRLPVSGRRLARRADPGGVPADQRPAPAERRLDLAARPSPVARPGPPGLLDHRWLRDVGVPRAPPGGGADLPDDAVLAGRGVDVHAPAGPGVARRVVARRCAGVRSAAASGQGASRPPDQRRAARARRGGDHVPRGDRGPLDGRAASPRAGPARRSAGAARLAGHVDRPGRAADEHRPRAGRPAARGGQGRSR